MKRKIIHQGNEKHGSYTVTLPVEWVKKYGFKAGDEIELHELGNALIIQTEKQLAGPKMVEIDGREFRVSQLWRNICQAYRLGANTIRVKYTDRVMIHARSGRTTRTRSEIELILTSLLGMEIYRTTKDEIIIQQFGEAMNEEFDNALRRAFFKFEEEIDEAKQSIKLMDYELMRHVWVIDRGLGRFCNFLLRILHTKGYKDYTKTDTLYATALQLEMLGDAIYQIPMQIAISNIKKVHPNLLRGLDLVKESFQSYVAYFYSHDEKHIENMSKVREEIMILTNPNNAVDGKNALLMGRIQFAAEIIGNMYDYAITPHEVPREEFPN